MGFGQNSIPFLRSTRSISRSGKSAARDSGISVIPHCIDLPQNHFKECRCPPLMMRSLRCVSPRFSKHYLFRVVSGTPSSSPEISNYPSKRLMFRNSAVTGYITKTYCFLGCIFWRVEIICQGDRGERADCWKKQTTNSIVWCV